MMERALIALPEVRRMAGISKTQIYKLSKSGDFPAPAKLGPHCTRWEKNEVQSWIEKRLREREPKGAA